MNPDAAEFVPTSSPSNNAVSKARAPSASREPAQSPAIRSPQSRRTRNQSKKTHQDYQQRGAPVAAKPNPRISARNMHRHDITHLMQFSLPSRSSYAQYSSREPGSSFRSSKNKSRKSLEPYSRERFVNANFRFVLSPTTPLHDFSIYLGDPDAFISWEHIQSVIIPTSSYLECPICLEPTHCARITKCGHVFCLPCLLHHIAISTSDEKARKKPFRGNECPICWSYVSSNEVKCVEEVQADHVMAKGEDKDEFGFDREGSGVAQLTLIRRSVGSNIALPMKDYNHWQVFPEIRHSPNNNSSMLSPGTNTNINTGTSMGSPKGSMSSSKSSTSINEPTPLPPTLTHPSAKRFSKVILGSIDYMYSKLTSDLEDLNNRFSNLEIQGKEVAVLPGSSIKKVVEEHGERTFLEMAVDVVKRELDGVLSSKSRAIEVIEQTRLSESSSKLASEQLDTGAGGGYYYYYQSTSGRHEFLSPLDIKILKAAYQDYIRFPYEISVPVLNKIASTVDDTFRKRCKYLSHLPSGCDLTILEVDLCGVVPENMLDKFKKELDARTARIEKAKRDAKRVDHAKDELALLYESSGIPYSSINSGIPSSSSSVELVQDIHSTREALSGLGLGLDQSAFPDILHPTQPTHSEVEAAVTASSPSGTISYSVLAEQTHSFAAIAKEAGQSKKSWTSSHQHHGTSAHYTSLSSSAAKNKHPEQEDLDEYDEEMLQFLKRAGESRASYSWYLDLHLDERSGEMDDQLHGQHDDITLDQGGKKSKKGKNKKVVLLNSGGHRGRY